MYYGHMSKSDILNSSRKFLYAIYQQYVKRACENLGIPSEQKEDANGLTESDYPEEFRKFTQKEREEKIEQSGISDDEFLSKFKQFKPL